jgi:Diadenosine tetraphosphate (Ap4A) hydrolase and other HIT family hydrolases
MQHIYSTWRSEYIGRDKHNEGCAFCLALQEQDGPENLIFHRGETCFVILNLFPYTSGHLMVVPYTHTNQLSDLPAETLNEMMQLVQKAVRVMEKVYHPQGFNVGLNLGSAAGAGIADHMHMHVVPRWQGDANFISVIGETRVLPEDLGLTYQRLSEAWQADNN